MSPDDFFRPPNDSDYETDELRTGPPLSYVAEKVRHNLEATHCLIDTIRRCVPDDLCMRSQPARVAALGWRTCFYLHRQIGDVPAASAILDRFLHHAEIITITGRSYRIDDRKNKNQPCKETQK